MPDNPLLRSSLHPANAPIAQPADRFSALNALAAAPSPTRRTGESAAQWETRVRAWSSTQPSRVAGETETAATTRAATNRRIGNQSQQRGAARRAGNTAVARAYLRRDDGEPSYPYNRNPYPQVNTIRPFVKNELNIRRNAALYPPTLVSRAPFARMTSGLEFVYNSNNIRIPTHQFLSLGLEGYADTTNFSQIYTDGSVIGYAVNISTHEQELIKAPLVDNIIHNNADRQANNLYHSPPGITSIRVEKRSAKGVYKSVVTWKCYDRNQLEALRPHFLTAGCTIILEWGQSLSDSTNIECFDFTDRKQTLGDRPAIPILTRLANYYRRGKDSIIYEYVDPNKGRADCVVGFCSNLEISLEQDGSFTCITHIMSMPETIFGISNIQTITSDNPADAENILTVRDYYLPGGIFLSKLADDEVDATVPERQKQIINATAHANEYTSNPSSELHRAATGVPGPSLSYMPPANVTPTIISTGASNNDDSYFISWAYFIAEIIPESLGLYQEEFSEMGKVLSMVNHRNEPTTVSYSPFLLSSDPGVLVVFNVSAIANPSEPRKTLARSQLAQIATEFKPINNEHPDRALLNTGVYINAGKIIEIFSKNEKFTDALEALLAAINTAMSGYWNLQLIFDEQVGKYVVVDEGQISLSVFGSDNRHSTISIHRDPYTYMFNSGSMSELLECNFKSTLGDLEKANIMMSSLSGNIRTSTPDQTNLIMNALPTNSGYIDRLRVKINEERGRDVTHRRSRSSAMLVNANDRNFIALVNPDNAAIVSLRRELLVVRDGQQRAINRMWNPFPHPTSQPAAAAAGFGTAVSTGQIGNIRGNGYHSGEDYLGSVNDPVAALYEGTLTWNADNPTTATTFVLHPTGLPNIEIHYSHLKHQFGKDPLPAGRSSPEGVHVKGGTLFGCLEDVAPRYARAGHPEMRYNHLHLEVIRTGVVGAPNDRVYISLMSLAPTLLTNPTTFNASQAAAAAVIPTDVPIPAITNAEILRDGVPFSQALAAYTTLTPAQATRLAVGEANANAATQQKVDLSSNYGVDISRYIAINPAGMLTNSIVGATGSNPFNGPALVKVELEITIMGIGGISITDCFKLDKIPEQYMQRGVFMVRGITENITSKGWTTTLTAMLLFTGTKTTRSTSAAVFNTSNMTGEQYTTTAETIAGENRARVVIEDVFAPRGLTFGNGPDDFEAEIATTAANYARREAAEANHRLGRAVPTP